MEIPELKDKVILLDGGMGTMLQAAGAPMGKVPEALCITHPEIILSIHEQYVEAGAQILYANTFQANAHKLQGSGYTVDEIVSAGISCAKKAAGNRAYVALDMGPIGELLAPNGNLSFEDAYAMFREVVLAGVKAGADLVVCETVSDLLEMKAAILAVKENSDLPMFATMAFETTGRTYLGVTVESFAMTATGLGVDALGINCSLGPEDIFPLTDRLLAYTDKPVIIKPNAGLPNVSTGAYDLTPELFAEQMRPFLAKGVSIVGGCCGTNPQFIAELSRQIRDLGEEWILSQRGAYVPKSSVCSALHVVDVDDVRVIGERINPTGKKKLKEALIGRDMTYIAEQAVSQVESGAQILDVNVGLPMVDEVAMMRDIIPYLQEITDVPLQIDSSDREAMEAGLRIYNGKPILNSVNGEASVMHAVLPLVKKYGAAVVGLTMDEGGIPLTAELRFDIAKRIVECAESYGIPREDVYIDCLTLTASAQQKEVAETLKAMDLVKSKLGVKIVLGVSNISFGLPLREQINTAFLTMALDHGLDLPIMNPASFSMMAAIDGFRVLMNRDAGAADYVNKYAALAAQQEAQKQTKNADSSSNSTAGAASAAGGKSTQAKSSAGVLPEDPHDRLFYAVKTGMKQEAYRVTEELLKTTEVLTVVNTILIPALDEVGAEYEKGTMYLPQLIQAANTAQESFGVIREYMKDHATETETKGKVVIATVKGDVHDIGKNIVKVIMENYGYEMIDLGKDVSPETVVEAMKTHQAKLLGLSALMTTTVPSMEETIRAVREAGIDCKIMVGGAVLTEEYAMRIGADYYSADAKQSVDIAKEVLG